jgi:phytoene desaturase
MNQKRDGKHVIVVGAGPGGLTAAMMLAYRGFKVTVFEKQARVGGRNGKIALGDYSFDIGPTFLMLKDVLDEVFREAGENGDSLMDMRRLDPMYRLVFGDNYIDPVDDRERMKQEIARVFPGHEDRYDAFFEREQDRFRHLFPCLQKSYHQLRTMFSPALMKALPHLGLGKSLFDIMYQTFGDEQLALTCTFQAKYLGMSPWECPGLFSIIPYIEHSMGIYHPIGGLSRISEVMAEVARQNGAEIHLESPVKRILVKNGAACGVELAGGDRVDADDVVINADFGYAATNLFEPGVLKKYTPAKMDRMKLSCSTFMMYLGLDCRYDLPHHAIFFAEDYRKNVEDVFAGKPVDKDISFYVRNASVTDDSLAPEGHSAVYVLVPTPNLRGAVDWRVEQDAFRENLLDKMEQRAGMKGLREHIVQEKIITPEGWRQDYDVFEGATFNLAHNLGQMIYLRPHNKFEELDHCYLVGGGTHPGSGLPTIYESGRIAANLLSRHYGVTFVSANLEV